MKLIENKSYLNVIKFGYLKTMINYFINLLILPYIIYSIGLEAYNSAAIGVVVMTVANITSLGFARTVFHIRSKYQKLYSTIFSIYIIYLSVLTLLLNFNWDFLKTTADYLLNTSFLDEHGPFQFTLILWLAIIAPVLNAHLDSILKVSITFASGILNNASYVFFLYIFHKFSIDLIYTPIFALSLSVILQFYFVTKDASKLYSIQQKPTRRQLIYVLKLLLRATIFSSITNIWEAMQRLMLPLLIGATSSYAVADLLLRITKAFQNLLSLMTLPLAGYLIKMKRQSQMVFALKLTKLNLFCVMAYLAAALIFFNFQNYYTYYHISYLLFTLSILTTTFYEPFVKVSISRREFISVPIIRYFPLYVTASIALYLLYEGNIFAVQSIFITLSASITAINIVFTLWLYRFLS